MFPEIEGPIFMVCFDSGGVSGAKFQDIWKGPSYGSVTGSLLSTHPLRPPPPESWPWVDSLQPDPKSSCSATVTALTLP